MYTCHAKPLIERQRVSSIREKQKRKAILKQCSHRMPESKPPQKQQLHTHV